MKVRSAIYYDKDLNPKAYAAEAFDEFIEAQVCTRLMTRELERATKLTIEPKAKDEGWKLVEAFKLRLHPSSLSATVSSDSTEPAMRLTLPSLPAGLDIESVYTDFIACLYNNTRQWYEENLAECVRSQPSVGAHADRRPVAVVAQSGTSSRPPR